MRAPPPVPSLPRPSLDRPFRLVALDWDGTAVPSRSSDATRAVGLIDGLLGLGVRVGIITGTNLDNLMRQIGGGIAVGNGRRLFLCANRGSEVFGLDRRGAPVVLFREVASAEEDRLLDAVAGTVAARLEALTGLVFEVVKGRMNRRKIDLYPGPRFRDPPKSALGELLVATEARLRGAGLRGGLAAVFRHAADRARPRPPGGARDGRRQTRRGEPHRQGGRDGLADARGRRAARDRAGGRAGDGRRKPADRGARGAITGCSTSPGSRGRWW